jgi:carbonic anhydrase
MLTFTTEQLKNIVKEASPGDAAVAEAVDQLQFLEFPHLEESVKDDVKFLQENSLILPETKISGWTYDVRTGKVCQLSLNLEKWRLSGLKVNRVA